MLDALLERFCQGDRRALARLLSLVARGEHLDAIRAALPPPETPGRVVAVTGSGGVGKSTLVGKLVSHVRGRGSRVAVLACDPESPLTGGALLGDRFRMAPATDDTGIFIRSLAAVGGQGAVAAHLDAMVRLFEAFGFDTILIETAGAGQGDTAVRALADVVVLLVQPETGDDLQWEKAGVLEVADVVVIHKADLPGAEQVEAQVRAMLGLSAGREVPVLRVSARTGDGLAALWDLVAAQPLRRRPAAHDARALLRVTQNTLTDWFAAAEAARDPMLEQLVEQWRQGALSDAEAGTALWHLLELLHGTRDESLSAASRS